jgi:hypothetical protein
MRTMEIHNTVYNGCTSVHAFAIIIMHVHMQACNIIVLIKCMAAYTCTA